MAYRGPLVPGVFNQLTGQLVTELATRMRVGLDGLGELVADRAKQSVASRSHPYRTHTPAARGGPPASISGTLASSLTWNVEGGAFMPELKVGTMPGHFPPYGKGRTPSSMYGYYLEKQGAGKSHVLFPFLLPAWRAIGPEGAYTVFRGAFAGFGL